jgi:signal transduction histidine kinase
MRRWFRSIRETAPDFRLAAFAALMIGIFVADTVTDLEIAVAVFYTAVILIAVTLLSARAVIILAGLCGILTVLSFVLTPTGSREAGFLNATISIVAIGVTTFLSLKVVAAERAAREARAKLDRMARVISVAELAASIAHEVNQPLAAIVTSGNAGLRWLDQQPSNVQKARRSLERIVDDANRASEIIARVRSLAKGEQPRRDPVNLNDVILEALAAAQRDITQHGIVLEIDLDAKLPNIVADKVQLQQVIANLVLNAIDAMDKTPWQERTLTIASTCDTTGEIVVTVADTGCGIATDVADHLFDAFWTTKATGVGIGLTVSRSIIEAHGGRIAVVPKQGPGAALQLRFPAAKGQVHE